MLLISIHVLFFILFCSAFRFGYTGKRDMTGVTKVIVEEDTETGVQDDDEEDEATPADEGTVTQSTLADEASDTVDAEVPTLRDNTSTRSTLIKRESIAKEIWVSSDGALVAPPTEPSAYASTMLPLFFFMLSIFFLFFVLFVSARLSLLTLLPAALTRSPSTTLSSKRYNHIISVKMLLNAPFTSSLFLFLSPLSLFSFLVFF